MEFLDLDGHRLLPSEITRNPFCCVPTQGTDEQAQEIMQRPQLSGADSNAEKEKRTTSSKVSVVMVTNALLEDLKEQGRDRS